jgi:peptide-methionine (S)-S-oxide reductase
MKQFTKIALGGGCHWCTEAVYQSLKGVESVEQGYVASTKGNEMFSEAVVVYFNTQIISTKELIEIHLYTHKSTSNHSMRDKYRSAIYTFSEKQSEKANDIVESFQKDFDYKLITKVFLFKTFEPSREQITNYYYKNPEKPFCKSFINPKLRLLLERFSQNVQTEKLNHLVPPET